MSILKIIHCYNSNFLYTNATSCCYLFFISFLFLIAFIISLVMRVSDPHITYLRCFISLIPPSVILMFLSHIKYRNFSISLIPMSVIF